MESMRCEDCGKFATMRAGSSIATRYDFVAMEPTHEHFRCLGCTEKLGPVQSNAKPSNGDMSPYQSLLTADIQ